MSILYTPEVVKLSKNDNTPKFDKSKFDAAIAMVHAKNGYNPTLLEQEPGADLIRETSNILSDAFDEGIATGELPLAMETKLRESLFLFSACKTHQELTEAAALLMTDKGKVKPFEQFARDVTKVHQDYNVNYLNSEYNFAVSSAQMCAKWADVERDGDDYNLQYRTADDGRVREAHRVLHNVTLPPSDPFWDKYYPPNGWGCRCDAVQVRKSKYEASDPEKAMKDGLESTKQISGGVDKGAIFRFNPGKSRQLFPPKHPYYKMSVGDKEQIKKIVKASIKNIETVQDLQQFISEISREKDWFVRGFKSLQVEHRASANGSTDRNGNIWLTRERIDLSIGGCNKLRKGLQIEQKEADAIATLWHEITHNRNKTTPERLTPKQRSKMELANEFVARNTLSEFYEAGGSKLQHSDFTRNRDSTGYNTMVRNYQSIIDKVGLQTESVVTSVKKHLFDKSYTNQEVGLVNALIENGATDKLSKTEIATLVKRCDVLSELGFAKTLSSLLVKD